MARRSLGRDPRIQKRLLALVTSSVAWSVLQRRLHLLWKDRAKRYGYPIGVFASVWQFALWRIPDERIARTVKDKPPVVYLHSGLGWESEEITGTFW